MMNRFTIALSLILFTLTTTIAQENQNKKKLGFYAGMDFQTQSVWLGWDIGNNQAAYIPCVVIDLWQTGFETAFWASLPMDREHKAYDDFEVFLKYNQNLFADNRGAFNFHGFIDYIWIPGQDQFPHRPILNEDNTYTAQTGLKQLWKLNIGIAFNNLIPIGNYHLVPAYDIYYITPANTAYFQPGSVHDLSFTYKRPLGRIANLNLSSHTLYHSRLFGVQALAATYASAVVSFPLGKGFSLNTQVNYQFSLDDGVNDENEFWGGAGISYSL